MSKRILNLFFLALVVLTVAVSVWGPEVLSNHRDRSLLGKAHLQEVEISGEGYRYELSGGEKLFILSQALSSQEFSRSNADDEGQEQYYQEPGGGYALVANYREPLGSGLSKEEAYEACSRELEALKETGILPASVRTVEPEFYEAALYSAIDVREPRNYVSVWKVELSDTLRGVSKENRLIEAYIDGDDGKIYGFYARTEREWEEIDPDQVIQGWCSHLGLPEPERDEEDNPLTEATPFFRKYVVPGTEDERTVVTVGFYEGIREMFIRITR